MRQIRLAYAFAAIAAAAMVCRSSFAIATEAIVGLGCRLVDALLALIPESPERFALAGDPAMTLDQRGTALDPALRQSMRHEAGVARRSADRHT